MLVPGAPCPWCFGSIEPVVVTFISNSELATSTSTPSFSLTLPSSTSERQFVVVCMSGSDSGSKTITPSFTMESNSGTALHSSRGSTQNSNYVWRSFIVTLPAGVANPTISWSISGGNGTRHHYAMWEIKNLQFPTSVIDFKSDGREAASSSATVNTEDGGAVISWFGQRRDSYQATTWSGVNEDFDFDGSSTQLSGGHIEGLTKGTLNVTETRAGNGGSRSLMGVLSFR